MIKLFEITAFSYWFFWHESSMTDVWQGSNFAFDHNTVNFLLRIPFKNCFSWEFPSKTVFLENSNKKDDMSDEFIKSVSLIKILICKNINLG